MDKRDQMYSKGWKLNFWWWTCCGYTEAEVEGSIPETRYLNKKKKNLKLEKITWSNHQ